MSIDLNWETLTSGPDGEVLAHRIRDFIHSKFQDVPLPRFIKSVTVHDFQFGTIGPQLELKDLTDPLPDFYEDDTDDADDAEGDDSADGPSGSASPGEEGADARARQGQHGRHSQHQHQHRHGESDSSLRTLTSDVITSRPSGGIPGGVPGGVPGGTSNLLHHFWSGTQTPLAAMVGAHHLGGGGGGGGGGYGSPDFQHDLYQALRLGLQNPASAMASGERAAGAGVDDLAHLQVPGGARHPTLREKHSVSTLAPTSQGGEASTSSSRPPTRGGGGDGGDGARAGSMVDEDEDLTRTLLLGQASTGAGAGPGGHAHRREPRAEDLQAVFRIRYAGDIKLLLTADILLDYPMPSFVGIPVRLSMTGLTFDGVGVLAYIRRRVHFCFLGPEDAVAAVGGDDDDADLEGAGGPAGARDGGPEPATATQQQQRPPPQTKLGGLLQEVRVESEIGQRDGGKQSLKNVGKVERFVLEQVRRIFEEEFVYPSFWTFLV